MLIQTILDAATQLRKTVDARSVMYRGARGSYCTEAVVEGHRDGRPRADARAI